MRATVPVTVHLFLIQGDQILLLRRFNTGYEDGKYSVPAGHLDGGESVTQAAIREAREEVGIDLEPDKVEFASVMHRWEGDEHVDFFVRVTRWKGEPHNREPHRCDDLGWFGIGALPANVVPYVRRALDNLLSGVAFAEFGW